MNVVSLFSGVGGMDEGLRRAGFRHLLLCESDGWRRGVLDVRFPGVAVADDVRDVCAGDDGARPAGVGTRRRAVGTGGGVAAADGSLIGATRVGLLCGGFPCQDLSVAGHRRGLAGDRSSLFFEYSRIVGALRPGWLLVENVPGLLSSNGGRDFGVVLGTLADLGYGLAWRILDSRYFGVPQRRRRVFIVGCLAHDDPRAAADRAGQVLAVGTRCQRHLETSREAAPDVAGALGGCPPGGGWRIGADEAAVNQLVARTLTKGERYDGDTEPFVVADTLTSGSHPGSHMPGRRREDDTNLVAFHQTQDPISGTDSPAIGRTSIGMGVSDGAMVRRLTPTECERLQGFPDHWTLVPDNAPDSRRYAALGDAVTVPVAEWIGQRIKAAA